MYNVLKHGCYVVFIGTENECYNYINSITEGFGSGDFRVLPSKEL